MSYIRVTAVLVLAVIGGVARVEVRPDGQPSPAESPKWATKALRAGIIGTDTSHVPAFTATFESHPEWKIKVVAAFKGGSPDVPISANRVEGFAKTIQEKHGVEIVDSIEALLGKVDVVLLESVDGRPHLAQITPVLKARKRVFVDKPLAASLEDARRIFQISKETGTPLFSASSARFHSDIRRLRENPGVGKVSKVQASYTLSPLVFHPDLYYYGIHGVEALYAVMGTGCVSVARNTEAGGDITTGKWKDGRVGVFYGLKRGEKLPVIQVSGDKGTTESSGPEGYENLVVAIAEFFQTGRSPVDPAQTLEVFEFMDAAQLSKERGGAEVRLAELRK
jgi:predicted dehydrogenase